MKNAKLGVVCLCLAILFGCSSETIQENPISQKVAEIEELVSHFEWEKANQEAKRIQELYTENKWKYQLLGDETEYNSIDEHITMLTVSLEEKDTKEAKLNIAMIEHYMESLYFK